MNILKSPKRETLETVLQRSSWDYRTYAPIVTDIFEDVKRNGEEALIRYTQNFDKVALTRIVRPLPDVVSISPELQRAIDTAFETIKTFHESQRTNGDKVTTFNGVTCWQKETPISKVGLYIPGGSAPLFSSVLMLGVPALLAGCEDIVMVTPPQPDGTIHPAIAYAAKKCGIKKLLTLGGVQAIAALVYGTKETPSCYKIFGPGNAFVTAAKIYAQTLGVAIDMPAGPSEVLIIADGSASPAFVAADLLAQAEHGPDSQVVLLTDNASLAAEVQQEVAVQLSTLPRANVAELALASSSLIVLNDMASCVEWSNYYAPEHLIIATENPMAILEGIENAGTVFLGNLGCESLGDYATGANHTLPTAGFAKAYSGITLSSFTKTITVQNITSEGIQNLGPSVITMANAEGLEGHANAVGLRLQDLPNTPKP